MSVIHDPTIAELQDHLRWLCDGVTALVDEATYTRYLPLASALLELRDYRARYAPSSASPTAAVAAIKARRAAVTPGAWTYDGAGNIGEICAAGTLLALTGYERDGFPESCPNASANGTAMAHYPQDIDTLLDLLYAATQRLALLEEESRR